MRDVLSSYEVPRELTMVIEDEAHSEFADEILLPQEAVEADKVVEEMKHDAIELVSFSKPSES